jgi:hypothetical protein
MPDPDQITTGQAATRQLASPPPPHSPAPGSAGTNQRTHLTATPAGGSLRSLLQRADLTPETLARRLNALARELGLSRQLDQKTPYKWLRGSAPRDPWPALTAHILSRRLGTPITAQDLGWQGSPVDPACPPADTGLALPWTVQNARSAVITAATTDHLIFLPVTGTALISPALHWLTAAPPGDPARATGPALGDARIGAIEDITASLRQADDRHGSAPVLPLARAHLRSVAGTVTRYACSTAAGTRLHAAAADLLGLAGWLSFDSTGPGQAQRYWLAGLRAAHAAGDRPAGASIVRYLSGQASADGQHSEAVTLARAARQGAGPGITPRAAAVLAFSAALAAARAGDRAAAGAAITDARQALASASPDTPEPGWARWLDDAAAAAQTGTASLHLQDWDQARSHLTTALRLLGPDRPRDRAIICARLGLACAGQGHPEPASRHGTTAARILARGTSSARCLTCLHDLQNALRPYGKHQAITSFREQLSQIT